MTGRVSGAFDRFFFRAEPADSIALFRIVIGLLTLFWATLITSDFQLWFTDQGVLPLANLPPRPMVITLWPLLTPWLDDLSSSLAIWALLLVSASSLTLGYRTRTSAALSFLAMASLHWRNPYVLNSGDTLLRIELLLLAVSPAGYAYSLDEALRRRRGLARSNVFEPWAVRLLQIQVCLVYLVTALAKSRGETWLNGTATFYATRLVQFQRLPLPALLTDHRVPIALSTWGTLAFESLFPILVWFPRLRKHALIAALFFHLTLEYSMNIPIFQWVMIGSLTLFIPPHSVRTAIARLEARWRRLRIGNPAASEAEAERSS